MWGKELLEEIERDYPDRLERAFKYREKHEFDVKKKIYLAAKKTPITDCKKLKNITIDLAPNDDSYESYGIAIIKKNYLEFLEDDDLINKFQTRLQEDLYGETYVVADIRFLPERVLSRSRKVGTAPYRAPHLEFRKRGCFLEYQSKKWVLIALPERRQYRLLQCLTNPLGAPKTIDAVFEEMKLLKDEFNGDLRDEFERVTAQKRIIKGTIREIYRKLKEKKVKKGTLSIRMDHKRVWIQIDRAVKV